MGIERVSTPEFNLIVGDNWPELDEATYAARAGEQFTNSQQLADGASTVTNMAVSVASNMQGDTANASEAKSTERINNLTAQSTVQANRAAGVGLSAQNILNTKTALNAIATGYETEWNAIKTQAVAEGWDQAQLQEAKGALVDEFKGQADTVGANFEQADTELKEQIKTGAEPAVPPSMPGGSGGLELPPELGQQMQGMLGQGMGMAQSLPQTLQGAVAPLGEQGQQALDKVLQAVQGGSGNVNVSPEMLDEMLAGQESGGSGGGSGESGAEAAPTDDGFKGENSSAAEATPVSMSTGGEDAGGGGESSGESGSAQNTAMMSGETAPSPAESPVTAAPPASATIPETQLSGESGASTSSGDTTSSPAGGAGGAGGAPTSGIRGDDQGVSRQSPVNDTAAGTHLTSDTMTAPPGTSAGAGTLGTTGLSAASGMGAGGLGAGMSAGGLGPAGGLGAGMGGGMGAGAMSGVGTTPVAGPSAAMAPTPPAPAPAAGPAAPTAPAGPGASVPTSGTAPSSPTPPVAPAATAGGAGTAALSQPVGVARDGASPSVIPAAVPAGGHPGAVQHMGDSTYTDAERRAGAVAAAVATSFTRAGVVTPVAVALLRDGVSVFTTADGIGVLPHNVALPVDVIPLAEIAEVNDLFRQDMTGCVNPGYVLKTVVELGILEDVRAIVATDNGTTEGVTYVTSDALKGAPSLPLVIHRDQFAGIDAADIPDAIDAIRSDWSITEKPSVEEALLNLTLTRWETVSDPAAAKVLVTWMVTDAEDSFAKGRVGEAAYMLMQAIRLGLPQG